jgi:hypothetical protein
MWATGAVELERHDRSVGQLVELRGGVHQVPAGDDRLLLHHVEEPVGLDPYADGRRGPEDLRAARQRTSHLRNAEQAVHAGECGFRHEILSRHAASGRGTGLDQPAEHAAVHRGGVGSLRGGVAAEQRLDRARRGLARRRADTQAPKRPVHGRQRLVERARPVRDAELQERRLLDDVHGPLGIPDAGELDHDPLVAHLLDHRFLHAELVHPLAEHGQGEVDVPRDVAGDPVRLVEFEAEVHAALEVEPELERDALLRGVAHGAVRAARANRHVAREETVDGERHEGADDQETVSD